MKKTLCTIIAGIGLVAYSPKINSQSILGTTADGSSYCFNSKTITVILSRRFSAVNKSYNNKPLDKITNYLTGRSQYSGNYDAVEMSVSNPADLYLNIDLDTGKEKHKSDENTVTINLSDPPGTKPTKDKPAYYTLSFTFENANRSNIWRSRTGFSVKLIKDGLYEVSGLTHDGIRRIIFPSCYQRSKGVKK